MSSSIRSGKPIINLRISHSTLPVFHGGGWAAERCPEEVEQAAYERGYREAAAAAREEMLRAAERFKALAREVEAFRASLADRMAEDTARLAVRIASKIIRRELTLDDTVNQIANALKKTSEESGLVVRVNAGELHDILRLLDEERIGIDPSELRLVADASVEPGGCIVDTQSGRTDARIETQLREIERILLGGSDDGNGC